MSISQVCIKTHARSVVYARPVSGVLRLWDILLKTVSLSPTPVPHTCTYVLTCIYYTQPSLLRGRERREKTCPCHLFACPIVISWRLIQLQAAERRLGVLFSSIWVLLFVWRLVLTHSLTHSLLLAKHRTISISSHVQNNSSRERKKSIDQSIYDLAGTPQDRVFSYYTNKNS